LQNRQETSNQVANLLDDNNVIGELDSEGMLNCTVKLHEQFEYWLKGEQRTILRKETVKLDKFRPANIVVSGMGGSGTIGDFLSKLLEDELEIPIIVNKDDDIPRFVDEKTLFIAVSYSGDTEETLYAYQEARDSQAKVICITSNGELKCLAEENKDALILIPDSMQPRASIGYLLTPALLMFHELGLISSVEEDIKETIGVLKTISEKFKPEVKTPNNKAKQIALWLEGKIPTVYGSRSYYGVVAMRLKTIFSENAKIHAWHNVFPELNHNDIEAWGARDKQNGDIAVIFLRDERDPSIIHIRVDEMKKIIMKRGTDVREIWVEESSSKLARVFSVLAYGDFVGTYLALLNGVNPTQVELIEQFKKNVKLAKEQRNVGNV